MLGYGRWCFNVHGTYDIACYNECALPLPICGATQEWSNDAKRNVRHVSEVERHAREKGRAVDWCNHILPPVVSALHVLSIYSLTLCERHLTACMCAATGGERRFQEEGRPRIE